VENLCGTFAQSPQCFKLIRGLGPEEDPDDRPKDGVFEGSFSLAYLYKASQGRKDVRSKIIPKHNVRVNFERSKGHDEGEYKISAGAPINLEYLNWSERHQKYPMKIAQHIMWTCKRNMWDPCRDPCRDRFYCQF